jgi:hypothetical protein
MSVLGEVGEFFKSFGGHIKSAFVKVFGEHVGEVLTQAAEQFVKTELGQVAVDVVKGLEASAGTGIDKKQAAFKQITQELEAQGKGLPTAAINFAIEFALQIIRGSAPQPA